MRRARNNVLRDIDLRLAAGFGLDRIEPSVQRRQAQDAGNRSPLDGRDLSG